MDKKNQHIYLYDIAIITRKWAEKVNVTQFNKEINE